MSVRKSGDRMKYFAYGSCMNPDDFFRTAPNATFLGAATLHHYRLGFTHYSRLRGGGVADIIQEQGECVEGILYDLSARDLLSLDAREGAPLVYRRKNIVVEIPSGKTEKALTYEVVRKLSEEVPPSIEYSMLIWNGAVILSPTYQNKLRSLLFGRNVDSFSLMETGDWKMEELS